MEGAAASALCWCGLVEGSCSGKEGAGRAVRSCQCAPLG